MRLRPGGSDGGHNGLKSIELMIGSREYPRLRFGVGNNYPKGMQADYVLGKWNKKEEPLVKVKIENAITVIENFISKGISLTMNDINKIVFEI
jgi:PTH1 family peptidyl-tRNA hydrolase